MISTTFFIIAVLVVGIWVIIEVKRLKHKLFAIFLIGLILFAYISFTMSMKDKNIDMRTIPGIVEGTKIYFSWLSSVFVNLKSITAYASKQEWKDYNNTNVSGDTNVTENNSSEKILSVDEIWNKLENN